MTASKLDKFMQDILVLPDDSIDKEHILTSVFLLNQEKNLEVYYAPFDYVNQKAKVIIAGITPGLQQMEIAYATARRCLLEGMPVDDVGRIAKQKASFAGTMRKNLVTMLDGLGLNVGLNIPSTNLLFSDQQNLLHTTSVIRYPVFKDGQNYTGHSPKIMKSSILRQYVFNVFAEELQLLTNTLVVPLGKAVSSVLESLANEGLVEKQRCLIGFPHPSGSNGHRVKEYNEQKENLSQIISQWFNR
ncbi:MAG: hypothetical protein SCK29_08925 [Bacillota bacterium]|nr:hypothetical protein [Bacillota bacterium]MDW7684222.1 hypothetical protein [Bacillota bacterium]